MKVVVLGAGASAYFDTRRPSWERPPTGEALLLRGKAMGLLDDPFFAELSEAAVMYAATRPAPSGSEFSVDIEDLLVWVADQFEADSASRLGGTIPRKAFDPQLVLGEATYFLYELLRAPIAAFRSRGDAYTRLAQSFHKQQFAVISLNYDTLFELAANNCKLGISYTQPVPPGSVPVIKLHGSVNWMNPLSRAVRFGGSGPFDPKMAMRLIYSNSFQMEPVQFLPPDDPVAYSWRDLLSDGENYFEVALIPPVGSMKNFQKMAVYQRMVDWSRTLLGSSDELVFIGTSLRAQDQVLRDLLRPALRRRPKITIAGGVNKAKAALVEIEPKADLASAQLFGTFEEYADIL
jgi:hypothetical protein